MKRDVSGSEKARPDQWSQNEAAGRIEDDRQQRAAAWEKNTPVMEARVRAPSGAILRDHTGKRIGEKAKGETFRVKAESGTKTLELVDENGKGLNHFVARNLLSLGSPVPPGRGENADAAGAAPKDAAPRSGGPTTGAIDSGPSAATPAEAPQTRKLTAQQNDAVERILELDGKPLSDRLAQKEDDLQVFAEAIDLLPKDKLDRAIDAGVDKGWMFNNEVGNVVATIDKAVQTREPRIYNKVRQAVAEKNEQLKDKNITFAMTTADEKAAKRVA